MKKVIRISGFGDKFVGVGFNSSQEPSGTPDALALYVKEEIKEALNKPADVELIRYRPAFGGLVSITPRFMPTATDDYTGAGFTIKQAQTLSESLGSSVYILEYYTSADANTQELLSTTYVKAEIPETYRVTLDTDGGVDRRYAELKFAKPVAGKLSPEFNIVYIPSDHRDKVGGETIYMRLHFFNARTGKLMQFSFSNDTNDTRYYLPVSLNHASRTYNFSGGVTAIDAHEFTPSANDKINNKFKAQVLSHLIIKRGRLSDILSPLLDPLGKDPLDSGDIGGEGVGDKTLSSLTSSSTKLYSTKSYNITWATSDPTKAYKLTLYSPTGQFPEKVLVEATTGETSFSYDYMKEDAGFTVSKMPQRTGVFKLSAINGRADDVLETTVTLYSQNRPIYAFGNGSVSPVTWPDGQQWTINYIVNNIGQETSEFVYFYIEYQDMVNSDVHTLGLGSGLAHLSQFQGTYAASQIPPEHWGGNPKLIAEVYAKDPSYDVESGNYSTYPFSIGVVHLNPS